MIQKQSKEIFSQDNFLNTASQHRSIALPESVRAPRSKLASSQPAEVSCDGNGAEDSQSHRRCFSSTQQNRPGPPLAGLQARVGSPAALLRFLLEAEPQLHTRSHVIAVTAPRRVRRDVKMLLTMTDDARL